MGKKLAFKLYTVFKIYKIIFDSTNNIFSMFVSGL